MADHHHIVIIGGGTAGISIAARLVDSDASPDVTLIDPSAKHYYQPLWTLVGGGVFDRTVTERDQRDLIPHGVNWIQQGVATIDADANQVTLTDGSAITYDYLVVTPGLTLDWGAVDGLAGNVGKHGICSNYSYDTVQSTWDNIRNFKGGRAIFTHPSTPIKCGGAPQKIMYLAEHRWDMDGKRSKAEIVFAKAGQGMFAVEKYKRALDRIVEERGIVTKFGHNLVGVDAPNQTAIFDVGGETVKMEFEMLHVTPPMKAHAFVAESSIANADGWVDVDKHTTQHVKYSNVFSCGDASGLPTSKTGAAIRKQAPTLVENLLAVRGGKAPTASYDGYTSCPLVTGYGRLILAEFDYDKNPKETFDFDQSQERYSMYALKAYGLPRLYWHGMLRGRM